MEFYALQSGTANEAEAKWKHKGVKAIGYDEINNHKILWETLSAWAERARNPDAWYKKTIEMAQKGPEVLAPHERGQVAHIVSTIEGAKRFANSTTPAPADWLCVFDPSVRFAEPSRLGTLYDRGELFEPFNAYGLDDDFIPPNIDPEKHNVRREIPKEAWNAFTITRLDRQNPNDDNFAALRGHWAINHPRLLPRLLHLGDWLSKVAHQSAAVWWAAGQNGLHPNIQNLIRYHLDRSGAKSSKEVRQAWRYIFESLETPDNEYKQSWFELGALIKLDGWTSAAIREFAFAHRPFMKVRRPWSWSPRPPNNSDIKLRDLINPDVEYPKSIIGVQIPDENLIEVISEFRKNIEYAVVLEKEIGGYGLENLCSIELDTDLEGDGWSRTHGLSAYVIYFVDLLKRLIVQNPQTAKKEYLSWPINDAKIFARLRIWISGQPGVLNGQEVGNLFCDLDDATFWHIRHQRDLLVALAKRWNEIPKDIKKKLEKRLLRGHVWQ